MFQHDDLKSMPPRKTIAARPRKKKNIEPEINVPPILESAEESSGAVLKQTFAAPGEFYPTPRFYRTIALSFLSLAVILILGVFYFTLGKAEINLFLKPKNVKVDFLLTVAEKAEGQNQIAGLVKQSVLKGEKDIAIKTEGAAGIPSQATGKVTIYNQTNRDQTLVATTRLLSPDNVLFRMKKTLVVPAKGGAESDVYADKPGPEGEIAPAKFTIPGLSAELQKVIYAESKEKMAGGLKFVRKLTEDDLKTAGEELARELAENGKKQMIEASATSSFDVYVFDYKIVSTKADVKVGEEKDSFKAAVEVKLVGVFYPAKELNKLLSANLRDSLNDNEVVAGSPSSAQVEFGKLLNGSGAELKVTQEALAQVSYLEDVIDKNKILGQKKRAVEEYFASLPWIEKAEVKLAPSWLRTVPKEMNKVKIKINQ